MTTPPLPEWLNDKIINDADHIRRVTGLQSNGNFYEAGATQYASVALSLKDALERIENELEQRQGGAFYGMSPHQQKIIYDIAREALSLFPEQGKEGKDG